MAEVRQTRRGRTGLGPDWSLRHAGPVRHGRADRPCGWILGIVAIVGSILNMIATAIVLA
jgi:hypothetical protein